MSISLAGSLLVASPTLRDPNFSRAVLFLVEHGDEGAIGLVLNRPTQSMVAEHVPEWAESVVAPDVIFVGGPVANEVAICLVAEPQDPPDGWIRGESGVGVVDAAQSPADYGGVSKARVYSGYSGWDAGQLEFEMSTGSWVVADAREGDVFTSTPIDLWRDVLANQTGRARMYSSFPDDLSSN